MTATSPPAGESPFLRAAVGVERSFESSLRLSAEAYVQTNGATDSAGMLAFSQNERVLRGELWALGRTYGALSASYELDPLATIQKALDAVPDVTFKGKVATIGSLAQHKVSKVSGKRTGVKVFDVIIDVTEPDPRLRPGDRVKLEGDHIERYP